MTKHILVIIKIRVVNSELVSSVYVIALGVVCYRGGVVGGTGRWR